MGPSVFLTKKPFQIDFWEGFFGEWIRGRPLSILKI
jgi:hypothetical protein